VLSKPTGDLEKGEEINMKEPSEVNPSLDCGLNIGAGNSTVVVEPEYENVSQHITQSANSVVARMSRGQLGKKPKPGPKPNFVALRVAEWSLQQKNNSNGPTSKPPPSKAGLRGQPGAAPPRPSAAVSLSKSTKTNFTAHLGPQFGNESSSDSHLYDKAIRVQLDVLQQISENMASADVPEVSSVTSTTTHSPASARPIYAKPKKRLVKEEPIYDEAIAVVTAAEEEEPLYDEAIVVHSNRLGLIANTTLEQMEPLYADPDDFSVDRSRSTPTTQCSDLQDSDLYEEAQPVNRMAIPRRGVYDNDDAIPVAF